VCDVAYLLITERITAQVLSDRQGLIVAQALGAEVTLPDLEEELARFDAALAAEPAVVDDKTRMARYLGVA